MLRVFSYFIFFCCLTTAAYADVEFNSDIFTLLKELGKPNIVLSLAKGTSIPVKLSVTGSVFRLEGASHLSLRLSRTLYLKFSGDEILASVDKISWGSFNELLDAEVKFQIDRDASGMPTVKIAADVNTKE